MTRLQATTQFRTRDTKHLPITFRLDRVLPLEMIGILDRKKYIHYRPYEAIQQGPVNTQACKETPNSQFDIDYST